MNAGEEVSGGLVAAGRDGAELLELAEEVLNEMACPLGVFINQRGFFGCEWVE
jgi:hypothetical protein